MSWSKFQKQDKLCLTCTYFSIDLFGKTIIILTYCRTLITQITRDCKITFEFLETWGFWNQFKLKFKKFDCNQIYTLSFKCSRLLSFCCLVNEVQLYLCNSAQFEFEFIGVLRHMRRYFSHICDGTVVQADWRRSCTYGLAPNAIDISPGFFNVPVLHRHGTTLFIGWIRHTTPFSRLLRHAGDTEDVFSTYTLCSTLALSLSLQVVAHTHDNAAVLWATIQFISICTESQYNASVTVHRL